MAQLQGKSFTIQRLAPRALANLALLKDDPPRSPQLLNLAFYFFQKNVEAFFVQIFQGEEKCQHQFFYSDAFLLAQRFTIVFWRINPTVKSKTSTKSWPKNSPKTVQEIIQDIVQNRQSLFKLKDQNKVRPCLS